MILVNTGQGDSLVLYDANKNYDSVLTAPTSADIFWHYSDEPATASRYVSTVPLDVEVVVPLSTEIDRDITIRAIPRTAYSPASAAQDLATAEQVTAESDRLAKAVLGLAVKAGKRFARISVDNWNRFSRVRRVDVTTDATFTDYTTYYFDLDRRKASGGDEDTEAEFNELPDYIDIERLPPDYPTGIAWDSDTYYVRVAHSVQSSARAAGATYEEKVASLRYSEMSDILEFDFEGAGDGSAAGGVVGLPDPHPYPADTGSGLVDAIRVSGDEYHLATPYRHGLMSADLPFGQYLGGRKVWTGQQIFVNGGGAIDDWTRDGGNLGPIKTTGLRTAPILPSVASLSYHADVSGDHPQIAAHGVLRHDTTPDPARHHFYRSTHDAGVTDDPPFFDSALALGRVAPAVWTDAAWRYSGRIDFALEAAIEAESDIVPVAVDIYGGRTSSDTTDATGTRGLRIDSRGDAVLGVGALAADATGGFAFLPQFAETPTTAEPAIAHSGYVAVAVDGTAIKLWNGSAWVGGSGANPAGTGSELQYRVDSSTFGAVADSAVDGPNVTFGGYVRLSNSVSLYGRNQADDGDVSIAYVSADDEVVLGNADLVVGASFVSTPNPVTIGGGDSTIALGTDGFQIFTLFDTAWSPVIALRRAGGSAEEPEDVDDADFLGILRFDARIGGSFTTVGTIASMYDSGGSTLFLFPDTSGGTVDIWGTTLVIRGAISFADGIRQTFNPNGTNAGINVGAHTANPSSLTNGDLWYNSTTNALNARINGATVALGVGGAPGGSGSELQYRSGASTFGAVTNSSVSGSAVTLGGPLTIQSSASDVVINTTTQDAYFTQYDDTFAGQINLRRARGTRTSPDNISNDDGLGVIQFAGRVGGSFNTYSRISAVYHSSGSTLNLIPDASGGTVRVWGATLTIDGTIGFADGVRQTFNPNGTNAGLNVGAHTADPSSLSNGDLWYDSTNNLLRARINGASVSLGASGANPAGSGSEIQFRSSASAFGAITDSAVSGANVTLAGSLTLNTANSDVVFSATTFDHALRIYDDSLGGQLRLGRARGSRSSPTNISNDDTLGIIDFEGRVGGSFVRYGRIFAAYNSGGSSLHLIPDTSGGTVRIWGTTLTIDGTIAFTDDIRQTFNPGATNAGFNVGSHAGNPSSLSNGDLWYNTATNALNARINGATVALSGGAPAGSGSELQFRNAGAFGAVTGSSVSGADVTLGGNLSIVADSSIIQYNRIYGTTVHPILWLHRGRGTFASPAAVQTNDALGTVAFSGQPDTGTTLALAHIGASVRAEAQADWDAGSTPTDLVFRTKSTISSTYGTVAMRIAHNRRVGIGAGITNADIDTPLHVLGNATFESTGGYGRVEVLESSGLIQNITSYAGTLSGSYLYLNKASGTESSPGNINDSGDTIGGIWFQGRVSGTMTALGAIIMTRQSSVDVLSLTVGSRHVTVTGSGLQFGLGSDAAGDTYYRGSTYLTRVAIGSSGTFYKSNGSAPGWSALAASDITSGELAMARGGTGASLADPNADRIVFWDDSANAMTWLEVGSGLSISGTTLTATGGGGGSPGGSGSEIQYRSGASTFGAVTGSSVSGADIALGGILQSLSADGQSYLDQFGAITANAFGSDASDVPTLTLGRGRGTRTSTTAIGSGDYLGRLRYRYSDGSFMIDGVTCEARYTAANRPTYEIKAAISDSATTHRVILNGYKTLTDNVSTQLFKIAFTGAENKAVGGLLQVTVIARNATDVQCVSKIVQWQAIHWNSGGFGAMSYEVLDSDIESASTGTLTTSFSTAGGDDCILSITADTTLGSLTEFYCLYEVICGGEKDVTLL